MFKHFVTALRRYLVAGLLIWVPLAATVLIFSLLLGFADRALLLLPQDLRESLLDLQIPGLGAILAITLLLTTGFLGANLIGRRLVHTYERILDRIPLVRSVYGSIKHFAEIVFSEDGTSFKKVLLIEYPRKGLYSLCFLTSENPLEVQHRTGEEVVTVFLPTTPNPTSGFMLFVPRRDIVELDMAVDDALKLIISLGVVVPKWSARHPESKLAGPGATP
ncbi:MAG TPA: DUF502 domain-containing protein [Gammaproteobacteria bacterium]